MKTISLAIILAPGNYLCPNQETAKVIGGVFVFMNINLKQKKNISIIDLINVEINLKLYKIKLC